MIDSVRVSKRRFIYAVVIIEGLGRVITGQFAAEVGNVLPDTTFDPRELEVRSRINERQVLAVSLGGTILSLGLIDCQGNDFLAIRGGAVEVADGGKAATTAFDLDGICGIVGVHLGNDPDTPRPDQPLARTVVAVLEAHANKALVKIRVEDVQIRRHRICGIQAKFLIRIKRPLFVDTNVSVRAHIAVHGDVSAVGTDGHVVEVAIYIVVAIDFRRAVYKQSATRIVEIHSARHSARCATMVPGDRSAIHIEVFVALDRRTSFGGGAAGNQPAVHIGFFPVVDR